MTKKNQSMNFLKKGFTMIELLVVVSIIGILASLALVSFTSSQRQARDAARKSDLRQYSTSLESFANNNSSLYPSRPDASGALASTTLCNDLSITTCPEDPRNLTDPTFTYRYQTDGAVSNGDPTAVQYVLWAELENTTDYWVVCSDGKVGAVTQASFGVSGGNCPL